MASFFENGHVQNKQTSSRYNIVLSSYQHVFIKVSGDNFLIWHAMQICQNLDTFQHILAHKILKADMHIYWSQILLDGTFWRENM